MSEEDLEIIEKFQRLEHIYGWFEGHTNNLAYDPGFEVECPYCGFELQEDPISLYRNIHIDFNPEILSHSLFLPGTGRCYIYREHDSCYYLRTGKDQDKIDSTLILALALAKRTELGMNEDDFNLMVDESFSEMLEDGRVHVIHGDQVPPT